MSSTTTGILEHPAQLVAINASPLSIFAACEVALVAIQQIADIAGHGSQVARYVQTDIFQIDRWKHAASIDMDLAEQGYALVNGKVVRLDEVAA